MVRMEVDAVRDEIGTLVDSAKVMGRESVSRWEKLGDAELLSNIRTERELLRQDERRIHELRTNADRMAAEKEELQSKQECLLELARQADQDRHLLSTDVENNRAKLNALRRDRLQIWEDRFNVQKEIATIKNEDWVAKNRPRAPASIQHVPQNRPYSTYTPAPRSQVPQTGGNTWASSVARRDDRGVRNDAGPAPSSVLTGPTEQPANPPHWMSFLSPDNAERIAPQVSRIGAGVGLPPPDLQDGISTPQWGGHPNGGPTSPAHHEPGGFDDPQEPAGPDQGFAEPSGEPGGFGFGDGNGADPEYPEHGSGHRERSADKKKKKHKHKKADKSPDGFGGF